MSPEVTVDVEARLVVRNAIHQLLRDFGRNPFFDLREADPQAQLLAAVRRTLQPSAVTARLSSNRTGSRHRFPLTAHTSRVHSEMKLGDRRVDLVVLRAGPEVDLTVYPAGAMDVVASLRGEDVVAVVEIKAAPSLTQEGTFRDDLRKLGSMVSEFSHCVGCFVALDKSLHLGGASSTALPRFGWLDALVEDPAGRVEAFWLAEDGSVRSRIGRV